MKIQFGKSDKKGRFGNWLAVSLLLGMSFQAQAAVTIKFATVAPEGTTWMDILKEAANEIKAKTNSNVLFKFYPGGIAGDEPDVLRKMRLGQYQGGGFTGAGMGEVLPEVRILELPFFYKNIKELDYVKERITSELESKLKEKGDVFLGWAEPGLVYFFSQKPIQTVEDMKGVKLWSLENDPLSNKIIEAFKVTPIHIALPDVLMALQTGMLNAVYAPPLAAMALQWHTKSKYMMSEPLTNSTGGVLISKKAWDQISPQDQGTVKAVFKASMAKLNEVTRKQNAEAIEKIRQMGIQLVPIKKEGQAEMVAAAAAIRPQLVGTLYSAEFLKKVEGILAEYRAKAKK